MRGPRSGRMLLWNHSTRLPIWAAFLRKPGPHTSMHGAYIPPGTAKWHPTATSSVLRYGQTPPTQTYPCTDTLLHRHTLARIHRHMDTRSRRHALTQTQPCTNTPSHRHTLIRTHPHTDTPLYGHTLAQTHPRTDTPSHGHTLTQTHPHTDTPLHRHTLAWTHPHRLTRTQPSESAVMSTGKGSRVARSPGVAEPRGTAPLSSSCVHMHGLGQVPRCHRPISGK